ncbi:DUF1648 domain-containing protein [Flavobacterium sp. j3]|uniref:DUF1648 domain-containing protein n=1 Tax=Flavobacterium aureirubrum TaxID=3133147 RepID=A0ABU9N6G7_9FLAO
MQPKIKIPLTITDKILEIIGVLLLLFFWVYTIYHYKELPEIIPTHFGAEGKPDGYGNKWTIFSLPAVSAIMYVGITIAIQFPHRFNYLVTITQENAEKQYLLVTRLFRIMKLTVLATFFLLDFQTIQIALGQPDIFGRWFLLLVFAMIFVPLFYFLIQSSKNA